MSAIALLAGRGARAARIIATMARVARGADATTTLGALSESDLRRAFELVLLIRGFETRAEQLFHAGEIRGGIHLGIGQEAVAVGARLVLAEGDTVVPTYRGHAYALAWGVPPEKAFGELLGREIGCNRGRGGSKHFGDASRGVLPSHAVVAAGIPIACGVALRARLDGLRRVCIAPFGDGATNQGVFHEALNLAAVWDLPVIFLCENNLYSEMTPIRKLVRIRRLAKRAAAYGMTGVTVDGMNVAAVAAAVSDATVRARADGGPTFIEALTYRLTGHHVGDTGSYRPRDEVERWRARDPIRLLRARLLAADVPEGELQTIADRVTATLDAALAIARDSPQPDPSTIALGTAPWMEVDR